jgi:hypothetical protein
MRRRDDFHATTRRALAERVGYHCSNPDCQQPTIGPSDETPGARSRIGVACHIAAASSGRGARRYDPAMSPEERRSISNGLWLCENCAKLIDTDEVQYSNPVLHEWRTHAEARAREAISGRASTQIGVKHPQVPPTEFRLCVARVYRDPEGIAFNFAFKNNGPQTLHDVQVSILLWRCSLSRGYTDLRSYTSANPVAAGHVISATLVAHITKPDVEPQFVVVSLVFQEQSCEKVEQRFFYKWGGVARGQPDLKLAHASREEREIIDRRHDAFQEWIAQLPGAHPLSLYSAETLDVERAKMVEACLQDCASLLKKEPIIPFHALARVERYRLQDNDELVSVCAKLEQYGYGNPMGVIKDWVPKTDWLDFLRHVQLSANVNATEGFDWLMEAEKWRREHGYPKPPGLPLA